MRRLAESANRNFSLHSISSFANCNSYESFFAFLRTVTCMHDVYRFTHSLVLCDLPFRVYALTTVVPSEIFKYEKDQTKCKAEAERIYEHYFGPSGCGLNVEEEHLIFVRSLLLLYFIFNYDIVPSMSGKGGILLSWTYFLKWDGISFFGFPKNHQKSYRLNELWWLTRFRNLDRKWNVLTAQFSC